MKLPILFTKLLKKNRKNNNNSISYEVFDVNNIHLPETKPVLFFNKFKNFVTATGGGIYWCDDELNLYGFGEEAFYVYVGDEIRKERERRLNEKKKINNNTKGRT